MDIICTSLEFRLFSLPVVEVANPQHGPLRRPLLSRPSTMLRQCPGARWSATLEVYLNALSVLRSTSRVCAEDLIPSLDLPTPDQAYFKRPPPQSPQKRKPKRRLFRQTKPAVACSIHSRRDLANGMTRCPSTHRQDLEKESGSIIRNSLIYTGSR